MGESLAGDMGALTVLFQVFCVTFSALFICCSGFFWFALGAFSGCSDPGCANNLQLQAIDATHGGVLVIFGIQAGLQIGWPPATILTLIFLGVAAIGLTVELALVFTIYDCSNNILFSTGQLILCGGTLPGFPDLGPYFGYMTFIIPMAVAWIAWGSLLGLAIIWGKGDDYYFDD